MSLVGTSRRFAAVPNFDAIGAKRTCRERRDLVAPARLTHSGHRPDRNPAAQGSIYESTPCLKGLGPWQELEYYAAHDKHVKSPGFPVVFMLLDGHAAPGPAVPAPTALDRERRPGGGSSANTAERNRGDAVLSDGGTVRNLWRVIDRPQGKNATLLEPDGPVGGCGWPPSGKTAPIQSTVIKTVPLHVGPGTECSVASGGGTQCSVASLSVR
jgi:hypothetical protein